MAQEPTYNELLEGLIARRDLLRIKVKELQDAQDELKRLENAISALGVQEVSLEVTPVSKEGVNFEKKWKWREKVNFVLNETFEAGTKGLAQTIYEKQGGSYPAIYNAVAQTVKKMVEDGELRARSNGRGLLYRRA